MYSTFPTFLRPLSNYLSFAKFSSTRRQWVPNFAQGMNVETMHVIYFLPAAKPTGHGTVGVVAVVVAGGLLWGNDLKGRPMVKVNQLFVYFHPLNFLRGGIYRSLIRFLFGVGSIVSHTSIIPHQTWVNKWVVTLRPIQISLLGGMTGIPCFLNKEIFYSIFKDLVNATGLWTKSVLVPLLGWT